MTKLLTPDEAAEIIGVGRRQIEEWIRRADDPLPSLSTGEAGSHRRIIADQIDAWLVREAERQQQASQGMLGRRRIA
jgi:excisionase family DNA binding protein